MAIVTASETSIPDLIEVEIPAIDRRENYADLTEFGFVGRCTNPNLEGHGYTV